VTVIDTGIGIASEHLHSIFEAFRQVDSSTTRQHGGVGLGLYIAQHFAQMLGGRVSVESELGRGSSFHFWLPVSDAVVVRAA
jgi:signal transduction histidine kinase